MIAPTGLLAPAAVSAEAALTDGTLVRLTLWPGGVLLVPGLEVGYAPAAEVRAARWILCLARDWRRLWLSRRPTWREEELRLESVEIEIVRSTDGDAPEVAAEATVAHRGEEQVLRACWQAVSAHPAIVAWS